MKTTVNKAHTAHYATNLMRWIASNAVLEAAYAHLIKNIDWFIFTHTRRHFRRVIKNMHALVRGLKFKLALNKTFIGPIDKGFDFLGYRFNAHDLIDLAQKTIDNLLNKRLQLYEQSASDQRVQA
jgi:hypothetical protein